MFAPPPFAIGSKLAVPVHLQALKYDIHADITQKVVSVTARLDFQVLQAGCPIFDMVPVPLGIRLDDDALGLAHWMVKIPSNELTQLRVLDVELTPDETHRLEIDYQLWEKVTFANGGVEMSFIMTDLMERGYLERYGPANLEFDQMPITINVTLSDNLAGHHIFANGKVVQRAETNSWQVAYPDYYTSSSCYFHLTYRDFKVLNGVYQSTDGRQIPITVYGEAGPPLNAAFERVPLILREQEDRFGAYAHEQLLIYFITNELGGMEYSGGARTGPEALRHEITHSWFARGVMPANGNAGWIDEAIAKWQDRDYFRVETIVQRQPVQLSGFSAYRRHTPQESYLLGSQLMAELDNLFENNGGLIPILAAWFESKKRQLITTEDFVDFLAQHTTIPLAPIFERYVYGDTNAMGFPEEVLNQ